MDNSKDIYYETFGDITNPAIILNAGISNQCIIWDEDFCIRLCDKGYYVIRYDYRDTGFSAKVNFNINPYNSLDLTYDTINILNNEGLTKAHYVGFSMGGQMAQLAAAYQPQYISSITLISTSSDFKPSFDAFNGIFKFKGLSAPNPLFMMSAVYLDFARHFNLDRITNYVKNWKLLDASSVTFEKEYFTNQAKLNFQRSDYTDSYINHVKAIKQSFNIHSQAIPLISTPTLILHGKKDPLFGIDHSRDLHKKIFNSRLVTWGDYAHALSPKYFERLINLIDDFIRNL